MDERKTHGMNTLLLILTALSLSAVLFAGCGEQGGDSGIPQEEIETMRVPVVTTPARIMTFEASVSLSGNIEAENYALVSARVGGTLDAIFVDEGDHVEAGTTELFQTDAVKLTRAMEIARQDLAVAESSLRESQAGLKANQADLVQKTADMKRHRNLHDKGVTAPHDLEVKEAEYEKAEAKVEHSEAFIDLAEARVRQAELSVTIAEKNLADSLVMAPISGTVSQRLREPGEMAAPGSPVLKIEDSSALEVSAFLPEDFYDRIVPGRTTVRVENGRRPLGEHLITFKSPVVNLTFRTFEIKCRLDNPPPDVVPGRMARVTVVLERRRGMGVPRDSVIKRDGASVVFTVDGGVARRVPVKTGLKTAGWLEITGGRLSRGASLISSGHDFVDDMDPVKVVKGDD